MLSPEWLICEIHNFLEITFVAECNYVNEECAPLINKLRSTVHNQQIWNKNIYDTINSFKILVKTENTSSVKFAKALPDSPDVSKIDVLYKKFQNFQEEIRKCAHNEISIPAELIQVRLLIISTLIYVACIA